MDKKLEKIVQVLQENFSTTVEEFRDEVHVFVQAENIIEALILLRDKYDFELLSAMTATDYCVMRSSRSYLSLRCAGAVPLAAKSGNCRAILNGAIHLNCPRSFQRV